MKKFPLIHFTSAVSIEETCRQAEHDMLAFLSIENEIDPFQLDHDDSMPSSPMLLDEDSTERYLHSEIKSDRLKSLSLIATFWPPRDKFALHCLRLAFNDQDTHIRGAALYCLVVKLRDFVEDSGGVLLSLHKFMEESFEPNDLTSVCTEADEYVAYADKFVKEKYSKEAGVYLDEMLSSNIAAQRRLKDPDSLVRCAALSILNDCWRNEVDVRACCLENLESERDLRVRDNIIGVLGAICFRTDDREVTKILAKLALSNTEELAIRRSAYLSLMAVTLRSAESILYASTGKFPDDVDWGWGRQYCQDS